MVLNPRFNWFFEDELITKFLPHTHTLPTSQGQEQEDSSHGTEAEAEAEEMEDITSVFWHIYSQLENGNGGKETNIVNHKLLHEALVSSGKFYVGDATQIIDDMVEVPEK